MATFQRALEWAAGVRNWAKDHPKQDWSGLIGMSDFDMAEKIIAAGCKNGSEAGAAIWAYLHPEESEEPGEESER